MYCLIPPPKKMESGNGFWRIPEAFSSLENLSLDSAPSGIKFQQDTSITHREGYHLFITPSEVVLRFREPVGRLYGLHTLRQLLRQASKGYVQCLAIEDAPDFPVRCISLDVSRDRMPRMDSLLPLIDLWASFKINQVHLYIEHTFAFSHHKKVWAQASPFTGEELQLIDTYCIERGIELVPTRNSFGHMERWLQYPEYHYLAESPAGYVDPWAVMRPHSSTISPVEEKALPFLAELFDEFLPHFQSSLCNIGGDEPFELGQGRSKAACEAQGLGKVYCNFLCKLHDMLSQRNKKMLCYGDIITRHPECIPLLPKDITVIDWGYERNHPFEKEAPMFADANMPFYLCAGTSTWNSIGGRWTNARGNILHAGQEGLKYGAQGLIVSEWGDNGHMQQYPIPLPGYLLGSATGWNVEAAEFLDVYHALALHVFGGETAMPLSHTLLRIGTLCDEIPQLSNATILGIMPISQIFPYYKNEFSRFKKTRFSELREELQSIRSLLDTFPTPHAPLYKRELAFSISHLDHATWLCGHCLEKKVKSPAQLSQQLRAQLATSLEALMDEYTVLWKERSREGGLNESISRMKSLYTLYKKGT